MNNNRNNRRNQPARTNNGNNNNTPRGGEEVNRGIHFQQRRMAGPQMGAHVSEAARRYAKTLHHPARAYAESDMAPPPGSEIAPVQVIGVQQEYLWRTNNAGEGAILIAPDCTVANDDIAAIGVTTNAYAPATGQIGTPGVTTGFNREAVTVNKYGTADFRRNPGAPSIGNNFSYQVIGIQIDTIDEGAVLTKQGDILSTQDQNDDTLAGQTVGTLIQNRSFTHWASLANCDEKQVHTTVMRITCKPDLKWVQTDATNGSVYRSNGSRTLRGQNYTMGQVVRGAPVNRPFRSWVTIIYMITGKRASNTQMQPVDPLGGALVRHGHHLVMAKHAEKSMALIGTPAAKSHSIFEHPGVRSVLNHVKELVGNGLTTAARGVANFVESHPVGALALGGAATQFLPL